MQQPDRRSHEDPVARGLQEVEALFVRILAVIQDIDPVLERQLDRRGCAHVGGDALAVRMRSPHRRGQLVGAHDRDVRAGVGNGLVAGDVELDRVHAFADQHPHGAQHLVRAVHHHGDRLAVEVHDGARRRGCRYWSAPDWPPAVAAPGAVPALMASRTAMSSRGFADPPLRQDVKPASRSDAGVSERQQRVLFRRDVAGVGDVRFVRERQVHMAVDQARDEGVPGNVDPSVPVRGSGRRRRAHLGDAIAADQHVRRERGPAAAVPDLSPLQQYGIHRWRSLASRHWH